MIETLQSFRITNIFINEVNKSSYSLPVDGKSKGAAYLGQPGINYHRFPSPCLANLTIQVKFPVIMAHPIPINTIQKVLHLQ